jgi:hypothetical protein
LFWLCLGFDWSSSCLSAGNNHKKIKFVYSLKLPTCVHQVAQNYGDSKCFLTVYGLYYYGYMEK